MKKYDQAEFKKDNYENSLKQYEGILSAEPNNLSALYEIAKLLFQSDNLIGANDNVLHLLKLDPNNANAYILLANILFTQKEYEKAEEIVKKSLNLNNEIPEGYITIGNIYIATNHLDKAVESLENGVKAIPDSSKIRDALSDAYVRQGKIANSINQLTFIFQGNPSWFQFCRLAYSYLYLNRYLLSITMVVAMYLANHLNIEIGLPIFIGIESVIGLISLISFNVGNKRHSISIIGMGLVVAIYIFIFPPQW